MNPFSYLSFLAMILYWIIGLHSVSRTPKNNLSWLFFLICASMGIWSLGFMFAYPAGNETQAYFWVKATSIAWLLFCPVFVHFTMELNRMNGRRLHPAFILLNYLPLIPIIAMTLTSDYRQLFTITRGIFGFQPHAATHHPLILFIGFFLAVWLTAGIILIGKWKNGLMEHKKKRQGNYLFTLTIVTVALNIATEFLLPAFGFRNFPTMGHFLTLIWVFGIWTIRFYPLSVENFSNILSERDLLEERLSLSEERYRVLVENLNVGIFRIPPDPHSHILLANPALSRMLGYFSPRELLQKNWISLFPKSEEALSYLSKLAESGSLRNQPAVMLRHDGKTVRMSINARAIRSGEGGIRFIDGTVEFANEAELAVEELEKRRGELENQVKTLEQRVEMEYTQNMEKEQMLILQSRQALMGEMFEAIVHQWKNPLNGLGLVFQNLQFMNASGNLGTEKISAKCENGMEIISHMSQTIDDFRRFFRPDKIRLDFSLPEIVRRSLDIFSFSILQSDIRVDFLPEPEVKTSGYPNEYLQVVMNLLYNARDALTEHPPRNPVIRIRVAFENGKSMLSVLDNAGGIPDEIRNHIFQTHFTTKKNGTGIGLHISKSIIEKSMGGSIEWRNVSWEEGSGAEFLVRL
jgi:PAS domain S-box-containing protein